MKNYTINGRVEREEIASDVAEGVLSLEEIKELVKRKEIKDAFIGTSYEKKVERKYWNKGYLEQLLNASVAEAFNEDYLFYLKEVSDFVHQETANKGIASFVNKNWPYIAFGAVCICAVVYFIMKSNH